MQVVRLILDNGWKLGKQRLFMCFELSEITLATWISTANLIMTWKTHNKVSVEADIGLPKAISMILSFTVINSLLARTIVAE